MPPRARASAPPRALHLRPPSGAPAAPPARRGFRGTARDRPRHRRVDGGAPLAELRAVGDLLRERMLEGILGLGIKLLLVDELARDELAKRVLELVGLGVDDPPRTGSANSLPITAAAWSTDFSRWVNGRCAPRAPPGRSPGPPRRSTGRASRYAPRAPSRAPDSISDWTTSSMKKGLPAVRARISSGSPVQDGSEPSRSASISSIASARAERAGSAGSRTSTSTPPGTRGGS